MSLLSHELLRNSYALEQQQLMLMQYRIRSHHLGVASIPVVQASTSDNPSHLRAHYLTQVGSAGGQTSTGMPANSRFGADGLSSLSRSRMIPAATASLGTLVSSTGRAATDILQQMQQAQLFGATFSMSSSMPNLGSQTASTTYASNLLLADALASQTYEELSEATARATASASPRGPQRLQAAEERPLYEGMPKRARFV
jgi:hypothetical protein